MREMVVGLRERRDRKVGDADWGAGGGQLDGWCRVGDSMCVCLCGWVGGCVFE